MKNRHFFLLNGTVYYRLGDEILRQMTLNGVMIRDDNKLPVKDGLGRAQQILQLNVAQRLKDSEINIAPNFEDVVLNNIIYLGEMTEEEFYKDSPVSKKS